MMGSTDDVADNERGAIGHTTDDSTGDLIAAQGELIATLRRQAETTETAAEREASTNRIETFSDGVFAIAITLPVLDVHAPLRSDVASRSLWDALGDRWSNYLSFLLSFIIVAVVWANHRTMFSYIRRADHGLVVLNTLLMLNVVTLPFCAALLGASINASQERQTALLVYTGTLVWGSLIYNALWRYAVYRHRLIDPQADPRVVRTLSARYLLGPILYLVAFGLAFVNGIASLAFCGFLAALYLLPGFTHHLRRADD